MSNPSSQYHNILFQINPGLVAAELDGDLVMMDAESGQYYGISGIGPRAFELLTSPISVDGLVKTITSEYEIDEKTCRQDVLKFLDLLTENNLAQRTKQR
uniref:PqqD family peptide modification chaperone n=1 Tax=uncultured Halomonas sp. TaxID=173971 RepID=UPI002635B77A|nr:PqqD family peptide modification chaperone [uncultured Halomonas sp.]